MEVEEGGPEEVFHADDEGDDGLELIFSDRNGSFAPRQALDQFKGRNRQYGNAVCPECKQSFVNAARLERHLAVHQVFGAYLCPLCGKTYKYEYNLFFHWRKTCQYLNELIKVEQRKDMDVQSLRLLVEEIVVKRNETEPLDVGISSRALFQGSPSVQLEMPIDPQSPLARACMICGILVHRNHLPQHEALHSSTVETGLRLLDMQSPTGGFFCDLCGVAFRRRDNLYTHWRSSCPEIMANIEHGAELFLSDTELKTMVLNLLLRLRRVSRQSPVRAIRTNRDGTEDGNPVVVRHVEDGSGATGEGEGPSTSSANSEGKALIFMDDYVNPADTVVDIDGELVNVVSADRGKWNIPEDGKPLECPDCFRQFANAGRLERHISGFHSHYGAFKCLLCGHRFKYDYNLLFHYRHSCAYTKLLVGADIRKLLDATSLRKLVSHIKQSDPQLRPGSSRLINVKRRPSLKAVPRNVQTVGSSAGKARLKRSLDEGKKCPVCGVMFYGQNSLDKHIGTVHLLSHNFLNKAITRENASPVMNSSSNNGGEIHPVTPSLSESLRISSERGKILPRQSYEVQKSIDEQEAPPILEIESPGEVAPTPTRCVDVDGEEITDFDAEQLSEMDMMLYTGQLALGDLVITSSYGEDVEYRVAVGTRHGSQIVLERTSKSSSVSARKEAADKGISGDGSTSGTYSRKDKKDFANGQCYVFEEEEDHRVEEDVGYAEEGDMTEYVDQDNTGDVEFEDDQLVGYEVSGTPVEQGRRLVRFVDSGGQQMLQYLNEEDLQCDSFVQYVEDENGQQIVEFVENEEGGDIVQYLNAENMSDGVVAYMKSQASSSSRKGEGISHDRMKSNDIQEASTEQFPTIQGPSAAISMPEDFMQEE